MNNCDVFVAGCGMAGASAALFAARGGLSVVQAGGTAEIVFASGLFDVYGAPDPWQAIARLAKDQPDHPYARLAPETVRTALETFLRWLGEKGLPYATGGDANCQMLTPMGACKTTWAVPETMWAGVEAVRAKAPTLLVDFAGLREYSATQIAAVAEKNWPGLRPVRLAFPAPAPLPLLPGSMAQALELPDHRTALADAIRPHIRDTAYVGLPAILGTALPGKAHADLQARLGLPVFEVPTLPASVPGMRLKSIFETHLAHEGVTTHRLIRALSVTPEGSGYRVALGGQTTEREILARHVILATGRFIGRGLRATRDGIRESILGLPVAQPNTRNDWHNDNLFHSQGHPVNRTGVMVDNAFRPVNAQGEVLYPRLHAIGTLLAHQDWIREKCGVGLAVATAWAAVQACLADK